MLVLEMTEAVVIADRLGGSLGRFRESTSGSPWTTSELATSSLGYLGELASRHPRDRPAGFLPRGMRARRQTGLSDDHRRARARPSTRGAWPRGSSSPTQYQVLRDLGYDLGQGFFVADPMESAGHHAEIAGGAPMVPRSATGNSDAASLQALTRPANPRHEPLRALAGRDLRRLDGYPPVARREQGYPRRDDLAQVHSSRTLHGACPSSASR